jgi:ribonuclease E
MPKRMLIDAAHPEETRVVVFNGNRLEEFDFESTTKKQVKGNIYLAKVTRVEPSLQAAFVDYGGNRHGFLAFSEIHPDYYRIPVSDRINGEADPTAGGRGAALDGGDESGVLLAAALPEPVPVPATPAGDEDAAGDDEASDRDATGGNDDPGDTSRDAERLADDKSVGDVATTTDVGPAGSAATSEAAPTAEAPAAPGSEGAPAAASEVAAPPAAALPAAVAEPETPVIAAPNDAGIDERGDFAATAIRGTEAAEPAAAPISEPEAIALRTAEDSIVAAEIIEPVANGDSDSGVYGEAIEAIDNEAAGSLSVETLGGDEVEEVEEADAERRRTHSQRNYKIQEVIKRRQIMLVQVAKEERGNKGAALTTYLSLAGRYCVLMPNTGRGGGVSRKITSLADRRRLKEILEELDIPEGMGVIVRTAGAERSKAEIKRDYEYLLRLWNEIRDLTLKSTAPALIYEEGNLIKRSIRDLYTRDMDEVLVEGEEGYRTAKAFMRTLMPSHAKRVQPYRDPQIGLFHRFQVESQIDAIHSPVAQLRSGGYIVINQTEALVSIDVNSGRSTRERNIEETALRTNIEAAEEIARQLRLRDLAGLIVIDFIDMEEHRNQIAVERRLKEALKSDRARIQVGRISPFGLLEMSRQRLRPSLAEASTQPCPHCGGTGFIRSVESAALYVLRSIEEEGIRRRSAELCIYVPTNVALYILNQKRESLGQIEGRYGIRVIVARDDSLIPPSFRLERLRPYGVGEAPLAPRSVQAPAIELEEDEEDEEEAVAAPAVPAPAEAGEAVGGPESEEDRARRRRRRRRRRPDEAREARPAPAIAPEPENQDQEAGVPAPEAAAAGEDDRDSEAGRRRRRGRRGGRTGRPNGRRDDREEAPRARHIAAETIEIVSTTEDERVAAEAAMQPDLESWPGDAGLEAASLAALAGDAPEPAPAAALHPAEAEEPAPTAEAEPGIPFVSETERMRETAAASEPIAANQDHIATAEVELASPAVEPTPAPAAEAADGAQPSTAAHADDDVLTVTEKPTNPRRGWWQRLMHS